MLNIAVFVFGLCQLFLTQATSNVTYSRNPEIINLDGIRGRSSKVNTASQFYWKFQTEEVFVLNRASSTFQKVPGLTLLFEHRTPRLYTIRIQGQLHSSSPTNTFVKILFDDYVVYANKLLVNNGGRSSFAASLGIDLFRLDARSGIHYGNGAGPLTIPCSKTEIFYVPPGLHAVDVGVRVDGSVQIEGFQLHAEVRELGLTEETNLPLLST